MWREFNFTSHLFSGSSQNHHFLPASIKQPKDVYGTLALSVRSCALDGNFSKHHEDPEWINMLFSLPPYPLWMLHTPLSSVPARSEHSDPSAPTPGRPLPEGLIETSIARLILAKERGGKPRLYLLHLFLQLPPAQKIGPVQDWTSAWPSLQHWWRQIWETGKRTKDWWGLHSFVMLELRCLGATKCGRIYPLSQELRQLGPWAWDQPGLPLWYTVSKINCPSTEIFCHTDPWVNS